eukprot:jgi/Mesvir1/5486/Mv25094-RA.1
MREIDEGDVSEQSESLRFPLSMSDGALDTDKKGETCMVYDVVFNLDVLKIAMVEPRLKRFLVELAVGWLNHKHGIELDPNYKLPKMKYKGDLTPHRIRVDPKTLISEIPSTLELLRQYCVCNTAVPIPIIFLSLPEQHGFPISGFVSLGLIVASTVWIPYVWIRFRRAYRCHSVISTGPK